MPIKQRQKMRAVACSVAARAIFLHQGHKGGC
jgi:hypothetical protein